MLIYFIGPVWGESKLKLHFMVRAPRRGCDLDACSEARRLCTMHQMSEVTYYYQVGFGVVESPESQACQLCTKIKSPP